MKWTIRSGDLECEVEADGAFMACVKAVKAEWPCSLGFLLTATPEGSDELDDDCMICSTERVLKEAGIEYQVSEAGKKLLGLAQSH